MHWHARYKIKVLMRSRQSCPRAPDDEPALAANNELATDELANVSRQLAQRLRTADRPRGGAGKR
jgi:hypothetical protein